MVRGEQRVRLHTCLSNSKMDFSNLCGCLIMPIGFSPYRFSLSLFLCGVLTSSCMISLRTKYQVQWGLPFQDALYHCKVCFIEFRGYLYALDS